jgi:hypothetical protein
MEKNLTLAALTFLLALTAHADNNKHKHKAMVRLTIATPEATHRSIVRKKDITTYRYRNRFGALATTQWPLTFRIETTKAVGFAVKATADERTREALVLRDPDDCLNLASLVEDFLLPAFDPACESAGEDETYIQVQNEKFDTFELADNVGTGNDVIRSRLVDDPYVAGGLFNTPYLALKQNKIEAVGPRTGGPASDDPAHPELDGYGFGADDDLSGLVLMVDMGGSRIFDTDFNHAPGVIRNLAGMINTVSVELLDGRRQTAITASMHPLAGVFEPIAVFDMSVTNPDYAGFDYLQRVDSAPITAFKLMSKIPLEDDPPSEANEFYDELLSTYYPADLVIHAVVVAGEAPDYIHDLNGDGKFSARDVLMAGYELVSNEVSMNLTVTHDNLFVDSEDIKCLPRTLIFDDLDGDGLSGEPFKCDGKSGSTRSRRVPR